MYLVQKIHCKIGNWGRLCQNVLHFSPDVTVVALFLLVKGKWNLGLTVLTFLVLKWTWFILLVQEMQVLNRKRTKSWGGEERWLVGAWHTPQSCQRAFVSPGSSPQILLCPDSCGREASRVHWACVDQAAFWGVEGALRLPSAQWELLCLPLQKFHLRGVRRWRGLRGHPPGAHRNTCVHSVLSVYQPESLWETGGALKRGSLRKAGTYRETTRIVQDPWAPKVELGDKGQLCYHVLERLLHGEGHQCGLCREPQPGHIFLLPADVLSASSH